MTSVYLQWIVANQLQIPFKNTNSSKRRPARRLLLPLRMSPPMQNILSTAAELGRGVDPPPTSILCTNIFFTQYKRVLTLTETGLNPNRDGS